MYLFSLYVDMSAHTDDVEMGLGAASFISRPRLATREV